MLLRLLAQTLARFQYASRQYLALLRTRTGKSSFPDSIWGATIQLREMKGAVKQLGVTYAALPQGHKITPGSFYLFS